jgi:hypothetical protein
MVQVKKALDQKETTFGVFLDIEGAFNTFAASYLNTQG